MKSYIPIYKHVTDFLLDQPDFMGLAVLQGLCNHADKFGITDIGIEGLSRKIHYEAKDKLEQFERAGWIQRRLYKAERMAYPRYQTQINPDILHVRPELLDQCWAWWNEPYTPTLYATDVDDRNVNVTTLIKEDQPVGSPVGSNQRSKPAKKPVKESEKKPERESTLSSQSEGQKQALEVEGQEQNYSASELLADFTSSERTHAANNVVDFQPRSEQRTQKDSEAIVNAVGAQSVEQTPRDISGNVMSSADLIMRVKDAAPKLAKLTIRRMISSSGGNVVQRVLEGMLMSKKPIDDPAAYMVATVAKIAENERRKVLDYGHDDHEASFKRAAENIEKMGRDIAASYERFGLK